MLQNVTKKYAFTTTCTKPVSLNINVYNNNFCYVCTDYEFMNAIKTLRKYRQQVAKSELRGLSPEAMARKHSNFARRVAEEMSYIPVCHKSFAGYKVRVNNHIYTMLLHYKVSFSVLRTSSLLYFPSF